MGSMTEILYVVLYLLGAGVTLYILYRLGLKAAIEKDSLTLLFLIATWPIIAIIMIGSAIVFAFESILSKKRVKDE
jgi:hypothetical protein